jgi:hypothetical protein
MANQLYRFTITVVDDDAVKASTSQYVQIPEATTGTNIAATLVDWATAVSALSDGAVTRVEASLVIDPGTAGLPVTPGGSEEVSEYGEFQWSLTGTDMKWTSGIPALVEAAVSGNQMDTTNADVIAYTTLITGALFTTGFFSDPKGIKITGRNATFLGTRKHRKQQHAKSFKLG